MARALLHEPKILFLDEPTSGLDPNTARLIREYILTLKAKGTTIVLTTHDMHEADELSDRIGIMYKGNLVALDTPEALKQQYGKDNIVIKYREARSNIKEVALPLYSQETAEFLYKRMNNGEIVSVHSQEASLADVFEKLTGSELK
ncbi:MAG: AAA family ATPase [Bacillaceae bacterium]|nr:AAA family ATPase [Bacillaceae bacterium]